MQHPIKHLQSADGEAWIGVLDAIYAVAMTLIAVELPGLVQHIAQFPITLMSDEMTAKLLVYLFAAYLATFLLFYELWTLHKTILRLGGLMSQAQNLLNGVILALSCLGAGNVILIIKSKQEITAVMLKQVDNAHQLVLRWAEEHCFIWISIFLIIAMMFQLMAWLSSFSVTSNEASKATLVQFGRNLAFKARFALASLLIWAPMLFGYKIFVEPLLILLMFLGFCFFEESILGWRKQRSSHS